MQPTASASRQRWPASARRRAPISVRAVSDTQHDGDEMYHTLYGGLRDDWKAGEPDKFDSIKTS